MEARIIAATSGHSATGLPPNVPTCPNERVRHPDSTLVIVKQQKPPARDQHRRLPDSFHRHLSADLSPEALPVVSLPAGELMLNTVNECGPMIAVMGSPSLSLALTI